MESMMRYVNRTARLSTLYRNEKLKAYGLKGIHHSYILNICRNPGIPQGKLAQMIFVDKSNVARQLATLEKNAYVYRVPSQVDGREQLVYPTEKAFEILPIVSKTLKEWNEDILVDFTQEEKEQLIEAMKKIMGRAKEIVNHLPNE